MRDAVFISYCRKDRKWLNELRKRLAIREHEAGIRVFADTDIKPGEKWADRIDEALAAAKVAVLLISADFLNSRFIADVELPAIYAAAEHGLQVAWIPVDTSYKLMSRDIAAYQSALAANPSLRPLAGLSRAEWDRELVGAAERILAMMGEQQPSVPERFVNNNLPARRGEFLGRDVERTQVIEALRSPYPPAIAIEGPAGTGKTSLALHMAHACASNSLASAGVPSFDFIFWFSPNAALDAPRQLADVLSEISRRSGYRLPPSTSRATREEHVDGLLRSLRILVVIDDADPASERELFEWATERLPEPTKVILTTRSLVNREVARVVRLRGFQLPDALSFIRLHGAEPSAVPTTDGPSRADQALIEVTGGNPLAIALILGLVDREDIGLAEAIAEVLGQGPGVPRLPLGELFNRVFEKSWTLLGREARQVLMTASVIGGADSVERALLRVSSGLTNEEFEMGVSECLGQWLLEREERPPKRRAALGDRDRRRVRIHALTRAFARNQLLRLPNRKGVEAEIRERCSQELLDWVGNVIRRPGLPTYWNALVRDEMAELDTEWPIIRTAMQWAANEGRDATLLGFVLLLIHYMDSRFYNSERLHFATKAVAAAARLERREEQAILRLDALAWTYIEEGEFERAMTEISAGAELVDKYMDGEQRADLLALSLAWRARVEVERDHAREAQALVAQTLAIECRDWIRCRVHMVAGDIALKLGENGQALEHYEAMAAAARQYGGEGRGYQVKWRLGVAYIANDRLDDADQQFDELRAFQRIEIGALYADYGGALVAARRGATTDARRLLSSVRARLTHRTSSNLLLQLVNKLEAEIGNSGRTGIEACKAPNAHT